MKNVAVVGISRDPSKPANSVPKYLLNAGYRIFPVNPSADKILGLNCYKTVDDIHDSIDIVDIFRPPQDVPPIVDAAIRRMARVVWMQEEIRNPEAAAKAEKHGLTAIWNRCMKNEHKRLMAVKHKD